MWLGLLTILAVGVVLAVHGLWQMSMFPPTNRGAVPHTFWVEGIIQRLGRTPAGALSVTVVAVTGRPATVKLDANKTSVFQQGSVLNLAHLKQGQEVIVRYEKDVARSVEIIHQPIPWGVGAIAPR